MRIFLFIISFMVAMTTNCTFALVPVGGETPLPDTQKWEEVLISNIYGALSVEYILIDGNLVSTTHKFVSHTNNMATMTRFDTTTIVTAPNIHIRVKDINSDSYEIYNYQTGQTNIIAKSTNYDESVFDTFSSDEPWYLEYKAFVDYEINSSKTYAILNTVNKSASTSCDVNCGLMRKLKVMGATLGWSLVCSAAPIGGVSLAPCIALTLPMVPYIAEFAVDCIFCNSYESEPDTDTPPDDIEVPIDTDWGNYCLASGDCGNFHEIDIPDFIENRYNFTCLHSVTTVVNIYDIYGTVIGTFRNSVCLQYGYTP